MPYEVESGTELECLFTFTAEGQPGTSHKASVLSLADGGVTVYIYIYICVYACIYIHVKRLAQSEVTSGR